MKQKLDIKTLSLSAVTASVIFVATFFLRIPIPMSSGYVHLGDGFILLSSSLLGPPAILAAALGSALCDVLSGFVVYAIPTFIIKGLMVWLVLKLNTSDNKYNLILALIVAEISMVVLYFLTDITLFGIAAALGSILGNSLQGLFGIIVGYFLINIFKNIKMPKL